MKTFGLLSGTGKKRNLVHIIVNTDPSILAMKVFIQSEAGNKGVLGINTESKQHKKLLKLQENNFCGWELPFIVQLAKGAQEDSDLCLQGQAKQCVVRAGV